MAFFHIRALSMIAFLFIAAVVSASSKDFKPPRTRKGHYLGRVFKGNAACKLHAIKEMRCEDLTEAKVRKLFAKCKPDASRREIKDAVEYLKEVKDLFWRSDMHAKKAGKKMKKSSRAVRGDQLQVVSRQSFRKHAKSYGTYDKKQRGPFVSGEWNFQFDTVKNSGFVASSTFPSVKVLASGSSKKCGLKLFFVCVHSYIQSDILVQSTAKRCYTSFPFIWRTTCKTAQHRVQYKYFGTSPTKGGRCWCKKECKRCQAA